MFMFVFSVLTISIVGLFFQVITALTSYFMSQQLGLGEQMLKWHSIAYSYACSTAGLAKAVGDTIKAADIAAWDTARANEVSGMYAWNTVYFNGTINGSATATKMIATYVLPTEKPSGYAPADVVHQLEKVTKRDHYKFGLVSAGSVTQTIFDAANVSIVYGGLPATLVNDTVVLISDATCSP